MFASKDDKVGIAVGVSEKLTNKFDAVQFVKDWFRRLLEDKVVVEERTLLKLEVKTNLKLKKLLKSLKL